MMDTTALATQILALITVHPTGDYSDEQDWTKHALTTEAFIAAMTPLLTCAVDAARRETWEHAAKYGDEEVAHWNPYPEPFENKSHCSSEDIGWQRCQARAQEAAEYASWCRAHVKEYP